MPKSKGRAKKKSPQQRPVDVAAPPQINPPWFVPVMCGLMIFGVLWVTTFYVTSGDYPIAIGYWNLVIGLGAIMAGFMMATRWR
ncbi:cell division protein CrgA [Ornithinimicrobium faecis]|uniref:Cell division protein CrgA n=1 Tax=Ornithinimicrobium faecis TaxID=2934158 RepID=A0ABY4YTT4_9MICO|nr:MULTISPECIES: cell division protein CrgA [unclassified Ornithinimicrobium]USQ80153.1 cell division protein CrgA [Ornithinimicrobium sp. HY1793]